jgi:hypothetical protein
MSVTFVNGWTNENTLELLNWNMGYAMERSWYNFFKNSHYQACRIPWWNKPYAARSIVHYLKMDHLTTIWLVKRSTL